MGLIYFDDVFKTVSVSELEKQMANCFKLPLPSVATDDSN